MFVLFIGGVGGDDDGVWWDVVAEGVALDEVFHGDDGEVAETAPWIEDEEAGGAGHASGGAGEFLE
jgi:hypothetical protein